VDQIRAARAAAPPDDTDTWVGEWSVVPARVDVWAQAAVNRTVHALVELHPFRLGDTKASPRLVQWVAGKWPPGAQVDSSRDVLAGRGLGVLTVTATEPDLDRSERPPGSEADLVAAALETAVNSVTSRLRSRSTPHRRWAGALARLPGSWLPPLALLPRAARDLDDPRTAWQTESVDFDARFSVHTSTVRTTAALLTPRVMAMLLDEVPEDCAVTVSGDAVHTWWPYPPAHPGSRHVADVVRGTVRLAAALPSFVLAEHPDLSGEVQAELESRTDRARRYRATRRPGHSPDPVIQRIYDEARAAAGLPPAP
jgi:hypothetical protein